MEESGIGEVGLMEIRPGVGSRAEFRMADGLLILRIVEAAGRTSEIQVDGKTAERLLFWLERTVGRDAMACPIQTASVLRGLLDRDGIDRLLPQADLAILEEATRIIEVIHGTAGKLFLDDQP